MTHRANLPTTAEVRTALDLLQKGAISTGTRPNVVTLARSLGLANTTFRRNFPTIVDELATPQHVATATTDVGVPVVGSLGDVNVRLRAENRQLREQQGLACAQIQRLSIECQQLREQLERATDVARIRPPNSPRHPL